MAENEQRSPPAAESTPSLPPPTWSDLVTVRHFSRLGSGGGRAATEIAHAPAAASRPPRMRPLLCRARNENETRTNNLVYTRGARGPFVARTGPTISSSKYRRGVKGFEGHASKTAARGLSPAYLFTCVPRRCACTMLPPPGPSPSDIIKRPL